MLFQSIIFLVVYFTCFYLLGVLKKNASIVDIGWGLGFVLLAWFHFIQGSLNQSLHLATVVTTLLVSVWGLRLAYHIFKRNHKKPEDFRYAAFRKDWGKTYYLRSYFQLFLFQGVVMFFVSLGFLYIGISEGNQITWLFILGILIWCLGFFFEAVGDHQLKMHIKNPANRGTLIQVGLWKYTRHPNYFGEATMWWGIFLIGLSVQAPLFIIISPLVITFMVRFVSGVPMLEKNLKKYPGFEEYTRKTNIFFPWFPKK